MKKLLIIILFLYGCKASHQIKIINARGLMATFLVTRTDTLAQLMEIVALQQSQIDSLKKGIVFLDTTNIFKIDTMGNVTFKDSLILHGVFSVTGAIYLAPDSAHMNKPVITDTIPNQPIDSIPTLPIDSTGFPIPLDSTQVLIRKF